MNGGLGGVGKQIGSDIFELGKGVVKSTAKVASDTLSGSIEQILSAPTGLVNVEDKEVKKQEAQREKQKKEAEKKQQEKRMFQEVKSQLNEYIERKRQLDQQIAQEKAQEEHEKKQKEAYDKQKKEGFLKQLMKRLAGQAHGETDRQKE